MSRKSDPKAYARLRARLDKYYRDDYRKKRWSLADLKKFVMLRKKGNSLAAITQVMGRSLASCQGVARKLKYLNELGLPWESATTSEKVLWRKLKESKNETKKT